MRNNFIGLLIVLVAVALFLFFYQGLFTASDEAIEPSDNTVDTGEDIIEPVKEVEAGAEEEMVDESIDEKAPDEESEPEGDEGHNASDDTEFLITDNPFQDFNRAREKGKPIVLKFYAET